MRSVLVSSAKGRRLRLRRGSLLQCTQSASLRALSTAANSADVSVLVLGSSTDVGKTIISAGVCLAALQAQRKVCYIKPLQTGELDEYFIQFYTNPKGINDIFVRTIQHWAPDNAHSLSPAASLEREDEGEEEEPMSDEDLLYALQREMKAFVDSESAPSAVPSAANSTAASNTVSSATHNTQSTQAQATESGKGGKHKPLFTIVETTGGALSPSPQGTSQADLYRSLSLPVLLVGDARNSGVSSTLCAFESLTLRGYKVLAVALIDRNEASSARHAALIEKHVNAKKQNSINNGEREYL